MDEAGKVGSHSFFDYLVDVFTNMYEQTPWWILIAVITAVAGFYLVRFVAKNLIVWSIVIVTICALFMYVAAPWVISFFSSVPAFSFLAGMFSAGIVISTIKKDLCIWSFSVLGFALSMIGQGGF